MKTKRPKPKSKAITQAAEFIQKAIEIKAARIPMDTGTTPTPATQFPALYFAPHLLASFDDIEVSR